MDKRVVIRPYCLVKLELAPYERTALFSKAPPEHALLALYLGLRDTLLSLVDIKSSLGRQRREKSATAMDADFSMRACHVQPLHRLGLCLESHLVRHLEHTLQAHGHGRVGSVTHPARLCFLQVKIHVLPCRDW